MASRNTYPQNTEAATMADELDSEEHDIIENPELRKIFSFHNTTDVTEVKPEVLIDISVVKQEILTLETRAENEPAGSDSRESIRMRLQELLRSPNRDDVESTDRKYHDLKVLNEEVDLGINFVGDEEDMKYPGLVDNFTWSNIPDVSCSGEPASWKKKIKLSKGTINKKRLKEKRQNVSDSVSETTPSSSKSNLFMCDKCHQKYNRKQNLIRHIATCYPFAYRIQNSIIAFMCDFCDYKCFHKSSLRKHILTHTGEKQYACNICDLKFFQVCHLNRHKRSHTGEKPYTCNICGFKFSVMSSLKRHMKTHTGEKPYLCDFCDIKFATHDNLIRHVRVHTGEKPYACDFCDYKCTQKGDMTKHRRMHTGEKPYSCKRCKYKTAYKSTLIKHVERRH